MNPQANNEHPNPPALDLKALPPKIRKAAKALIAERRKNQQTARRLERQAQTALNKATTAQEKAQAAQKRWLTTQHRINRHNSQADARRPALITDLSAACQGTEHTAGNIIIAINELDRPQTHAA